MTTDTYPKLADPHGADRWRRGHDRRLRQGRRHDRAGHGDHARLCLHRRGDRRADALQTLLRQVGRASSFNAITVDSDTSTSDTLLLFATGAAAARGAPEIESANDRRLDAFRRRSTRCCSISRIRWSGTARARANSSRSSSRARRIAAPAKRIALSIANSPLVKTAIAGEDANWGRVVMAVGKAGEQADRDKLAIWFGDMRVAHKGLRDPAYDEAAVSALMKRRRRSRSASISASARGRARSGPATSPRNMSRSTATIGAEITW